MSKLKDLINILCPNGVEYKPLYSIVSISTGKLNANAMVEDGEYAFFTCDANPFRIDKYAFDGEAILISGNGSQVGHLNYYIGKFNAYQRTYVLMNFVDDIVPKYLYHYLNTYLKGHIDENSKKGSVPYITLPMLQGFNVPIPPVEVQEEIVKILDKFGELEARKSQYEFWRGKLFEKENVKYMKISEFAKCYAGATPSTFHSEYWENGTIPWMSSGEVNNIEIYDTEKKITKLGYNSSSTKMLPINTVVVALAGQGKTRGLVAITRKEVCTNQSLCGIVPDERVDNEYLFHYLQSRYKDLRRISSGDGTRGGLNLK